MTEAESKILVKVVELINPVVQQLLQGVDKYLPFLPEENSNTLPACCGGAAKISESSYSSMISMIFVRFAFTSVFVFFAHAVHKFTEEMLKESKRVSHQNAKRLADTAQIVLLCCVYPVDLFIFLLSSGVFLSRKIAEKYEYPIKWVQGIGALTALLILSGSTDLNVDQLPIMLLQSYVAFTYSAAGTRLGAMIASRVVVIGKNMNHFFYGTNVSRFHDQTDISAPVQRVR